MKISSNKYFIHPAKKITGLYMSIPLDSITAKHHEYEISMDSSESPDDEIIPEPELNPIKEQEVTRKRLVLKMYFNEFPEELAPYKSLKSKIDTMGHQEIEELRTEFEQSLGMKSSLNAINSIAFRGISMLEALTNRFTPMDVTGLTDMCYRDDAFTKDMKLVCLKYCEYANTSPEIRLSMSLFGNMVLLDRLRKMQAVDIDAGPVDDEYLDI